MCHPVQMKVLNLSHERNKNGPCYFMMFDRNPIAKRLEQMMIVGFILRDFRIPKCQFNVAVKEAILCARLYSKRHKPAFRGIHFCEYVTAFRKCRQLCNFFYSFGAPNEIYASIVGATVRVIRRVWKVLESILGS